MHVVVLQRDCVRTISINIVPTLYTIHTLCYYYYFRMIIRTYTQCCLLGVMRRYIIILKTTWLPYTRAFYLIIQWWLVIQCSGPSPINLSIRDNRNWFFFPFWRKQISTAPSHLSFLRITDGTWNNHHHHHGYNTTTLIFRRFFLTSIFIFQNYFPSVCFFIFSSRPSFYAKSYCVVLFFFVHMDMSTHHNHQR